MIEQAHLQTFELTLTTHGPLFIGNGIKLPRKEYLADMQRQTVSFLDEEKMFDLLIEENCVGLFEQYCMGADGNLQDFFFKWCKFSREDVKSAIRYEISAADALDRSHSLKDIWRFIRDSQGNAYVPGSSIKGALRTALLYQAISESDIEPKGNISEIPEWEYLHKLTLNPAKPNDAINSLMRGIQVSDSEPISDKNFILVMKTDASTSGNLGTINLCRECVRPNTVIRSRITLDQSVLKNQITAKSIMAAINAFANYYEKTYRQHFWEPDDAVPLSPRNLLYLGGGAGFLSKTLVYPYYGEAKGLAETSNILQRSFRKHNHDRDVNNGISPRTEKYGKVNNQLYHFGACEVGIR